LFDFPSVDWKQRETKSLLQSALPPSRPLKTLQVQIFIYHQQSKSPEELVISVPEASTSGRMVDLIKVRSAEPNCHEKKLLTPVYRKHIWLKRMNLYQNPTGLFALLRMMVHLTNMFLVLIMFQKSSSLIADLLKLYEMSSP